MVVTIDGKVTINGKFCAMGPRSVFSIFIINIGLFSLKLSDYL